MWNLANVVRKLRKPADEAGPNPGLPEIRFADLSEQPDPEQLPPLDRPGVDEAQLTSDQRAWRRDGVLILPGFLPDDLVDGYVERRMQLGNPAGWQMATPYMHIPELRALALYPPLMEKMRELIGEEMMLHLALTGWVSTQRDWHQDDYLNPGFVNSWYAAVWMALDSIHPDSGPFQYVPGSHRWGLLRGQKVRAFLTDEELNRREASTGINQWPKYAERFTTPAIEAEIRATGSEIRPFLGRRGDVLIWHGRLVHRGAAPRSPGKERRSLITHYSGVNHRSDMMARERDQNGQLYAAFLDPLM
jgi:Phytanoyl-CoA dioxygenase (PhyH)